MTVMKKTELFYQVTYKCTKYHGDIYVWSQSSEAWRISRPKFETRSCLGQLQSLNTDILWFQWR